MSFSLNRIELIGNLGRDAETRFTTNNTSVTSFSLATTYSYKKEDEWQKITTWHYCVAYRLSDFYRDQLVKGAKVYVEGRLNKREYTDKEGVKRNIAEVIVEKIIPLGETREHSAASDQETDYDAASPEDEDLPF